MVLNGVALCDNDQQCSVVRDQMTKVWERIGQKRGATTNGALRSFVWRSIDRRLAPSPVESFPPRISRNNDLYVCDRVLSDSPCIIMDSSYKSIEGPFQALRLQHSPGNIREYASRGTDTVLTAIMTNSVLQRNSCMPYSPPFRPCIATILSQ